MGEKGSAISLKTSCLLSSGWSVPDYVGYGGDNEETGTEKNMPNLMEVILRADRFEPEGGRTCTGPSVDFVTAVMRAKKGGQRGGGQMRIRKW